MIVELANQFAFVLLLILSFLDISPQSSDDLIIAFRSVRLVTMGAILDLAMHDGMSAAIGKEIQRAVTEQAIKILLIFSLVTRKVITLRVPEESVVVTHDNARIVDVAMTQ